MAGLFGWPGNYASDADDGTWQQVTTLKSNTSGAHWVTPVGIPFKHGVAGDGIAKNVGTTQRTKMFARYPNNGSGTLYPIQTEHFKTRADGKQIHCTGHVKLPAGYVALEKVGIGFKTSEATPSTPNWGTLTAGGDDFEVQLSIYRPAVHWISRYTNKYPYPGDKIKVTIADGAGSDLVYDHVFLNEKNQVYGYSDLQDKSWAFELMREITVDPSGRYRCFKDGGNGQLYKSVPYGYYPHRTITYAPNGNANQTEVTYAVGFNTQNRGNDYNIRPYKWSSGYGFFLWARRVAGNPPTGTVAVDITRATLLTLSNIADLGSSHPWLNYDGSTVDFAVGSSYWVQGVTSGARGQIVSRTRVAGAGKIVVSNHFGTFIDNEALIFHDTYDQVAGNGFVNGAALVKPVITSSGGATAKYAGNRDGYACVYDVTGTFVNGHTLTCTNDGTGTISASPGTSDFEVFLGPNSTEGGTDASHGTSGTIPAIQADRANRVVWTATFNAATATADSPWHSGTEVYQEEKRGPFMNGATPHPHLECVFRVSTDKDGNKVFREATVENSKMYASPGAIEYFYDAEVFVGGVSQTTGETKYNELIHRPGMEWSWEGQGTKFAMCDPADFMLSRVVPPWKRFSTVDRTVHLRHVVQGGYVNGAAYTTLTTSARGGLTWEDQRVRETPNEPLYPANLQYNRLGGGRPELGLFTSFDWAFWTGDVFAAWPTFKGLADNNRTQEAYYRNDAGTAQTGFVKHTPHPYMDWDVYPYKYGANQWKLGTWYNDANMVVGGVPTQYYGLIQPVSSQASHFPSAPQFSAYIAQPQKKFHDSMRGYVWFNCLQIMDQNNRVSTPKTSGVPGDVDHIIGFSGANSNRTSAWPAREYSKLAFIMHEGHPARTTYRRVAQDQADTFNDITSLTRWGYYHTRYGKVPYTDAGTEIYVFDSNNRVLDYMIPLLDGETVPLHSFWTPPTYSLSVGYGAMQVTSIDVFKSAYMNMVMMYAADLNACSGAGPQAGIDLCTWQLKSLEAGYNYDGSHAKWHWLLGANGSAYQLAPYNLTLIIKNRVGTFAVGDSLTVTAPGGSSQGQFTATVANYFEIETGDSTGNYIVLEGGANQPAIVTARPVGQTLKCGHDWTIVASPSGATADSNGECYERFHSVTAPVTTVFSGSDPDMTAYFENQIMAFINYYLDLDVIDETTADHDLDYVTGYNFEKQQQGGLMMLSRHHSDPAVRTRAKYYFDLINSTWSHNDARSTSDYPSGTRSDRFQQLDFSDDSDLTAW